MIRTKYMVVLAPMEIKTFLIEFWIISTWGWWFHHSILLLSLLFAATCTLFYIKPGFLNLDWVLL
jgi:hypothetical protein